MVNEAIPETAIKAAERACDLCGITPHSDMRVFARQAAIVAIMADRQRDQWMPIETAPKDGTEILGYGQSSYDGKKYAAGRHVVWFDAGKWWGRDPDTLVGIDITHWQHLPAPPKSEA